MRYLAITYLRLDVDPRMRHIKHPGSRGGHIIGHDAHGEPIYGKLGQKPSIQKQIPQQLKPPPKFRKVQIQKKVELPKWVDLDKSFGDTRKQAEEKFGKMGHGVGLEEAKTALTKFVSNSKVHVRVHSSALQGILDSGRFKNQYEIKKSGGMYAPEGRLAAEELLFGTSSSPPPPNDVRAVYGYLHPPTKSHDEGVDLDRYGDVRITLKDSVKSKTTFTVGDSLGSSARPSPVHDPGVESYTGDMGGSMGKTVKGTKRLQYVEAQIHGGMSVKDIESITFIGGEQMTSMDKRSRSRLKKSLANLGVSVNIEKAA